MLLIILILIKTQQFWDDGKRRFGLCQSQKIEPCTQLMVNQQLQQLADHKLLMRHQKGGDSFTKLKHVNELPIN